MASRMRKNWSGQGLSRRQKSTSAEGIENGGLHRHPPTPNCVEPIADSAENIRHACGGILDFSPRPSLALNET